MSVAFLKQWITPGPTIDAFMAAREEVEIVMGSVGSGKTIGGHIKSLQKIAQQKPHPRDGIRYRKLCTVRDTYVNLWKSTIPSWLQFVPAEGPGIAFEGGKGRPATHTINFELEGYGRCCFIVDFTAIQDKAAEDALRGYEPTDFLNDEADRLADDVLSYQATRIGRFPPPGEVEPYCPAIYNVCNAPIFDTWLYRLVTERMQEGVNFFRQPPAIVPDGQGGYRINPAAENVHNVKIAYYARQLKLYRDGIMDEMDFRRMLLLEFGFDRSGLPVYHDENGKPLFRDTWHVARDNLEPLPRLPLEIGMDQGPHAAAVIRQRLPIGQRRALDEIVCLHGTDPEVFGEMLNEMLGRRYRGWKLDDIYAFGDPAGFSGHEYLSEERVFFLKVANVTGLRIRPGGPPSNTLQLRRQAMAKVLRGTVAGGEPMYLISPRCVQLRKAYNGGYHYQKVLAATSAGTVRHGVKPADNSAKDVADADAYAELGGGGFDEVLERRSRSANQERQTSALSRLAPRADHNAQRQTRARI